MTNSMRRHMLIVALACLLTAVAGMMNGDPIAGGILALVVAVWDLGWTATEIRQEMVLSRLQGQMRGAADSAAADAQVGRIEDALYAHGETVREAARGQ